MSSELERNLKGLAELPMEPASPYEPMTVAPRYGPPRGNIDPDRSKGWFRRVLPVLSTRKSMFIFALFCALVAMLSQVAVPRVVMAAIDRALDARVDALMPYVWALTGLAAARGVFTYLNRNYLFRFAYDLESDLRALLYEHLGRLSFSFYDRVQSGELISRANSDIRSLQMFLTFAPLMVLNMSSFLFALVLMLNVHVPLTIVAMLPLPFVFMVGMRMRQLLFPISWVVQARQAETASVVEENISGVRVVKSFAAEHRQLGVLERAAQRLRWATIKQMDIRATYGPIMENLPRAGMAAVLLYGGILAVQGVVTIGTIVAFTTYVVMLQAPFRMLGGLMMMAQRASASAGRIYEILDQKPEIVDRPGAVDLVDARGEVEYRDVSFSYAEGPKVLDRFNFRLEPGETVALVGRTGSGKSTVARLLTRFYDVDDGQVLVDGRDVRDLTQASLRAHVSVVFDEPFLFSSTIRENIAYGRPDASLEEVRRAARAANAAEFIERLPRGYDAVIGERGYDLSGGQRQRLAIARTLLVNPRILVLDDATSAVDVKVEDEIHTALRELMRERTTLVIAHRLSTISLAQRVALLEGGRIVASGSHAELMATEPRYAEVLAHIEREEEEAAPAERQAEPSGRRR